MGFLDHDDHEKVRSTSGHGETFQSIVERRLSRRSFLKSAVAASAIVFAAPVVGRTIAQTDDELPADASGLGFETIAGQPKENDSLLVPPSYVAVPFLRWGDPLTPDAPEFDADNQTAAAQAQQFGYNCDFVGFLPLPLGTDSSDSGLLVVNHEYTNPDIMFDGYVEGAPTQAQVDVELAAHGVSVVQIGLANDSWTYDRTGTANRRYTATSPMTASGPAAGSDWFKTSADETGLNILGTLNNCAAGKTPWGTVVTAEENFHQYFANNGLLEDDDPIKAMHDRYGVPEEASDRRWENFYDRFDVSKEPNEPFRFGWAVEIDPYDPDFVPVKRTAIGRYRHEAQTFVVADSGQVAVYSGDDARFEYVYKFVTSGIYNPDYRTANLGLLDEGILYVARFNDDGTGDWLPLLHGEGPLTEENGFASQADVLVKTRQAGDLLGATKMDRPEDIEPNPVNKKVYIALTNNTNRGVDDNPGVDAANPRPENANGHIIELTETDDNHAATTFAWEIFLLCGDPEDEDTFFAGFPKENVSAIANPDNITFDNKGNLWISTDGQPRTLEINDGLFAVPVSGPERGLLRQFFSSVAGSEVCGPEFTPDDTSLFVAIQHPGEGGTFAEPVSTWPDGEVPPRPSIVAIRAANGGRVGEEGDFQPTQRVYLPMINR
ncbi:MAG: PhoX family phosphatase [Chloroflexi bacterium AL-W]|nr:PhoX family phosphatase [Chloroflexi bacterium AL-N1]NOK66953.1 PhoX family phosphatase [Chloroflexi bacterium AL-N10]NOK74755.1 PhoX family phosphatase [Chloroflexi bacterium AL-N5]NOK81555.1 PhoX family phosphatase [Chloroflexi bacterium AL-W]NOK89025.1 PhoX family phosphatase [Chloroflexi bacterium AL-N15]